MFLISPIWSVCAVAVCWIRMSNRRTLHDFKNGFMVYGFVLFLDAVSRQIIVHLRYVF
jgi:hypothetical protein